MTRFVNTFDAEIEELLEGRNSKNTSNVISMAVKIIRDYFEDMAINISVEDLENDSNEKLNLVLRKFYAELRKKNGELYSKSSLISIRYGLQRHFLKLKGVDIINNQEFKSANDVFKACLVKVKREGKGETKHKDVISEEDREKMYSTGVLSTSAPSTLQNKVFFELLLFFCNRGRENVREMEKNDFQICIDAQGKRFVKQNISRLTKNHRGDTADSDDKSPRMYEEPGNERYPVNSFEKYLAKLHPDNKWLWQKPREGFEEEDSVWFCNVPVGKNTLGNMMQKISKEANLSKMYTNHCIRATCISVLDECGYEARHIIGLSGHKSESSIKHYASRLNESKKRDMSTAVSSKVLSVTRKTVAMENTTANFEQLDFLNDIDDQYLMNVLEQPVMNTKPRPQNFFTNCSVTINYNYNKD